MRRSALPLVAVTAVGVALACGEDFKPETVVEDFRVLGIRADPPELLPGETAQVSALVVDPSAPGRRNTMVWLACDPDPLDLGRSACSELDRFQDPSALVQSQDGGTAELPPGMHLAGFGPKAFYTAPADVFANALAEDPRRTQGAVAQLLLLAVAEEVPLNATREQLDALFQRVRNKEVPSITAIFRLRVSEAPNRNQNPDHFALVVDGQRVPDGAHVMLRRDDDALVSVVADAVDEERYVQLTPDGPEERTEKLAAAPYSTGGRFTLERLAVNSDVSTRYSPPGLDNPVPAQDKGRVWLVVRDTRGGQAWREYRMHFCEAVRETPAVTSVELSSSPLPASGGGSVTLRGERLEDVVDVVAGEVALDGAYSAAAGAWVGVLPPVAAGTRELRLRTRGCVEVPTGYSVIAQ